MDQTQTALFPICQYIKGNGNRCGSPALSGARFCYHHFGGSVAALKRAHAQSASQTASSAASSSASSSGKLDFVAATSREAIQHNLFVIARGINDGALDLIVANFYHRLFRTCEINLTRWERANKDNPEKQMASPNTVTPTDDVVIPSEASGANETEELVLSEAKEPAFSQPAPAPNMVTPTDNLVIPIEVSGTNETEGPASSPPATTLPIPADPNAVYNSEEAKQLFREIDKRYMHSPDYGRRTSDALDALLHGGPVHEWLHEILTGTGFSPSATAQNAMGL